MRRQVVTPPIEGREDFVRDNATSLLAERDRRIDNLRLEVRRLTRRCQSMAAEVARLRGMPWRPVRPASPRPRGSD